MLGVVARFGLHAIDLAVRGQCLGRQQRAAEQAAAAQWGEQIVKVRHFLQQLHGGCALPGDHMGMVEWRHQRHAALAGDALADGFAVFLEAVVGDDLGTIAARGGQLGGGRVFGHDDGGRHAQDAR
ncbi:hypothetical protein SDC9_190866 [bioreactor metagenome]|uniref:Uncharacterized protein n=1 Tax=bioreactor metagenome TaxID=1076179 RepID=A0A645HWD3_9ZZZZ